MELKLDITDIGLHKEAAKKLLDFADGKKIFLFDAPVGSGKTTFIKSLCEYLEVTSTISSPTYSIVNEYIATNGKKIFHFDLYRLKSSAELQEIGFEEYLDTGDYIFIEWPELAIPFLDLYLTIIITKELNNRYLYARF